MSDPTALVPVRTGPSPKSRLAHLLPAERRGALAEALFRRVVDVLVECGLRVVGLSVAPLDAPHGVEVWTDERPGLNGAVAAALARLSGPAVIVMADLPWLTRGDVRLLLEEAGDVVIARTADGGTSGMLLRERIEPRFGAHSALVHAAAARSAGLRARVVDLPGFDEDLDDEAALSRAAGLLPPALGLR